MKSLAILLGLLLIGANAFAQIEAYSSTRVSSSRRMLSQLTPQFSYTGSILDGNETQNLDGQRSGIGAGLRLDIGRTDFVFETGLVYRQLGGPAYLYSEEEARQRGLTSRLESDIELNYLTVPLMAKYYLNGRENASFFVRGGLQPSALIYREARLRNSNSSGVKDISVFNDFDIVGALGVGFQIPINETTMIVMDGTYLRGFISVFNTSSVYNNGFSGNIGLAILL